MTPAPRLLRGVWPVVRKGCLPIDASEKSEAALKITEVETYLVGHEWKSWVFTRLRTDEGIHGVGEGSVGHFGRSVAGAIQDLTHFVIGADPLNVDALWLTLTRDSYTDGGQIKMAAIAAIETACLDIAGKALGVPIHMLLGGRCRDKVRLYANGWYRTERTPEAFAERAAAVVRSGYTGLKFDPFGTAWRLPGRADLDLAVDIVAAVREAVGPEVDLMIEAHSRFGVRSAIRVAEMLAPHSPTWFEEPVPHQMLRATAEVARQSPVPIASGESLSSKHAVAELLALGGVEIYQLEPLHLGGALATRRIADMIDAHYGSVGPHSASGPVAAALCLHLDAAMPNFCLQEYFGDFDGSLAHELVDKPLQVTDGHLPVPTAPGLGIDLDVDALRAHPFDGSPDMNLFTPQWHHRMAAPVVVNGPRVGE